MGLIYVTDSKSQDVLSLSTSSCTRRVSGTGIRYKDVLSTAKRIVYRGPSRDSCRGRSAQPFAGALASAQDVLILIGEYPLEHIGVAGRLQGNRPEVVLDQR